MNESVFTNAQNENNDKGAPLDRANLISLDREYFDYVKSGSFGRNPDADFAWLDDWTERRFGVNGGGKGRMWNRSPNKQPFTSPWEYSGKIEEMLNKGYEAITTPEEKAWLAAEKSGNREEMIKLANISLTKRGTNIADTISPIESQSVRIADIPKTDEEIDNELKEYGRKIKLQNFSAHFLTFADDFTPDEKEIVYASLRYGDGLPAEKEADYLAVWRDNPEKAARLHYLVELSRKNEWAWMRDNLVHPFVTGIENIRYGIGDELGDFAEFQGAISAMKEIVSRDGERRMWNAAERETYRKLVETESKNPLAGRIERMGLGPREIIDGICAKRMAREALPREEQLKRRKEELMIRLATSHKPYDDYDPISNAISGAIGTIPYMAVAAVPYAGIAINTLAQFGNVRNDIIMNGGNPDEGIGTQFLLAAGWSAIEKQQFLTFSKPLTGLQKKAILERIAQTAWKNGKLGALGSAIRQGTPEFVAKTFAECVEEGLQGAVEGGTKQWWMPEEKGGGDWTKTMSAALTQGGQNFVDSIGTMGLLSLVGGGINQTQARRNALSVESVVDYTGKKMQVMNIMTGRVKEMADNKDAPANAQKMLNEITQIWKAHKGNAVAALDEMREKYGLTDDQARTVGDYLDLQSTLLNIARTSKTDKEANAIAAFAGGAYRVGQTTGMGDTAYDVVDLFRMISPNITVEDIEVDDTTKAPTASPAVENLRQERDAAVKRIEEAKVGSQRKAAERELRRINKRLKAAEAKENAVSYPKMTMRRVTIPVGKNGETRSFVIRENNEAPDIHSEGYAQSVADAIKGAEGLKAGEKVSLQEFKALGSDKYGSADKLNIAVTQAQYMSMSNEERVAYVQKHHLGGSGSFALLDNNGKEIFNSDAIVKLFRGKVGTTGARIGGNWSLAHEYTHGVVRFLRDIDAIDESTVALMRRLFGEPTSGNELWNEEAMANGFAEFLRGEFDFRRLTPEERREAMGFFERVWDIIKDFFRRIFGKEIDEPPVVASKRKEAERAVFNAIRNGDLSGLDQYAGIEFEEEKRGEAKVKGEGEVAQDAQKQPSTPSETKTTNEPPKGEERAPTASTSSNTTKDAPKEPAKAEIAPTTDVEAVVEQIENPIATAANLPVRTDTKMTVFTPGYEMEIECEMMWVPLDELVESTDDREVQMRDRSRRATDEQVRSKTRKGVFQPLALFPGKKSDDGAPIVGGGMKIISGHGRKRMLEQLAKEGRFGEYVSAINAEAQRQGVPIAPEGMKNPVLVLRVTGGLDKKSDLNRFAELSNRWGGLERSGAELAESDARKITDTLLRLYAPDASGNLLAASNRDFMVAFLKEVGATGLTNADGTPTPEAALRVQRALMTAIFGNDEKIRAIIQNLLEKSGELSLGNLQNALMRSAGKLLAMKRAKGSFDIVNDVREAAYHYIAWRSAQQKQKSLSFADYLSEQDMFAEVATPMQAALAKLLEVGRFGTVLDEYAKLVAQEAVDAQGTFGFAEKRTPLQLLGFAERNTLAAEETPVTPDPASAEAAAPVQTPPAVSEEEGIGNREEGIGEKSLPTSPTTVPLSTAQAVITPPEPETFTPAPRVRGTATLPGPGADGIKAHQVNANSEATTRVKTLPAGAWNLLRAPYDVRRPPKASAQDKAGRGLKISNPPPVKWNDIFPHFQGNKTEMADRTSQAIRANMSKAEREHYTTVVDYFGGGGCWGLFHALANFPNTKTLVVNEFDPDRLGKIRLLHEIDGEVAEIAYKLLDERYEEIRAAAKDSSSPSTIANVVESQFKRFYTDPTERAAIQAFIDCAHTLLATSKDAQGNAINDTRLGIRRAIETLREDGRKAKEAADAFKAREGATIRYVSGDAVANADTLPHGDDVMAIADPPYYLTADYQQNTILGLEKVPDNWSYRATQEFLHKLVDSGDGLVYTDEAWWYKEAYNPDQQEDLFGGGSTFAKEQEILLDIINTLDHFDVAGRVVGRQEVLGVHHGHTSDTRTEGSTNGNAVRHDAIDNAGRGRGAGSSVLEVATEPQAQSGDDGAFSAQRGRDGAQPAAGRARTPARGLGRPDDAAGNGTAARASVIASGRRALAREVIIQDIAASIESAATEIAQGATIDLDAVSRLARYSVRQVREERMAEYAEFVQTNAEQLLKTMDADGLPIPLEMRADQSMSDIRYSVTPSLVAVKNFTKKDLLKDFARGYTINPSAAVIAAGTPFSEYGEITAIYSKDSFANDPVWEQDAGTYVQNGKIYSDLENDAPDEYRRYTIDTLDEKSLFEPDLSVRQVLEKRIGKSESYIRDELGWQYAEVKKAGKLAISEIKALVVSKDIGDDIVELAKEHNIPIYTYNGKGIEVEEDWFTAHGTNSKDRARIVKKIATDMNLRFSVQMGKRAREEAEAAITKYRPELAINEAMYNEAKDKMTDGGASIYSQTISHAVDQIAAFATPKERKAALLWFCKDTIRLPEDSPKVTEALKTAERAKVDPMQYDRPGDILEEFSKFRPKEPPINPDTVPELSDKRDMGSGVTTYLVQDDKAGQLAMRKIINTHWGKDANPWCLLQGDGYGNLSDGSNGGYDAWHYWQHYNSLPKRVAFQDGKLLAFMATDGHSGGIMADEDVKEQWWDRADQSHDGIPMKRVTKSESEYGTSTTTEFIEIMQDGTEVSTGKKRESIASDGTRTEEQWNDTFGIYTRRETLPSGVTIKHERGSALERTNYSTVYDYLFEAIKSLSNNTYEDITWWHDNYTHYRLITKGGAYVLYKYERGAFRETDVEYASETVNAWLSSAEAALRRGEAVPPLPESNETNTQRFSIVTPAEDAAYLDAVERGDMNTAQRIVREAFLRAYPDTKVLDEDGLPLIVYRGDDHNENKMFFGYNEEDWLVRNWFTSSKVVADFFTNQVRDTGGKTRAFFLNITNPASYDAQGKRYDNLNYEGEFVSNGVVDALEGNYPDADGVVLRNIVETDTINAVADDWLVRDNLADAANRIKSADPVTYDDAGNVIPLSQRFNPKSNDIRFSVSGIYTGSSADYEKPSLHYVGSGEGAQAFGWGLYGTNRRGIAEYYARNTGKLPNDSESYSENHQRVYDFLRNAIQDQDLKDGYSFEDIISRDYVPASRADVDDIMGMLESAVKPDVWASKKIYEVEAKAREMYLASISQLIYEQTFFTNRASGDESHLLKWYSSERPRTLLKKIRSNLTEDQANTFNKMYNKAYRSGPGGSAQAVYNQDIYEMLTTILGSPKDATEFLRDKCDIDGIKYPVNSYRGPIRDGDKEGWNYVSFRDDNIRVDHKWVDGAPRFSVTITKPWRKDFPNAAVMTTRKAILEKHKDLFTKAKAGDVEAAADLIDALMADKKRLAKVRELKRRHPKAAFVAAVHAEEATGRNKIPYSFAKFIAKTLGIKTTDSIVQTVRAEHSGADAWHRLTHRAQFAGTVERGKEYILVDDHITQGGTLNELRSYIENEGGKVVDVIALTSSKGSTILAPRKETIDELKTRYPDINRLLQEADIAGRVEALTNSEAEYIKTFSPDTFRNRIAEAGLERSRRLSGETLGEPPSDSVARTAWSETPEERHHVRRGSTPRNTEDIITAYVAAQIIGGNNVSVEDVRKIIGSAMPGTSAAQVLERANATAENAKNRAVATASKSVADNVGSISNMLESDRLNKALSDAVTMGAKAANPETGRKLQQAIERKRIRDLQSAEGFTAAEIMAELPISLADGVLATAELERTPEELARLEEAKKKREEERAKALETEEGAEELADPETPMRDPTEAERKAVDDLLDRARMRDDLTKQEEKRKRDEKAKRDAAEAENSDTDSDAGGDAADDMPLLPEETVRRIAPVFESADVFSWFIIELTGDKTLEKHPELPSTGEMWKSPVAVRELKKTAADILRRLAKDTLGSPSINYARNLVDRAINELESDLETKTFNSVRRKIAHIYTMIWDNAHRITKNELMKELEKTVSKLTQKGRFSYTQEEIDRKIPAKIERWAKWVLKYARMGEAKLQDEIANLEKLTSENPASEDGKMPTPVELAEAADKLAVAKVYGHLKGKTVGEMRNLIDQIAAKLDGERQAFELRRAKIEEANKTIVDALVNALTQGKANRRKRAKARGIIDKAMESMISSIDQQMVDLIRFCTDPELRRKALEAIDELTILINEGGNRYRNTLATAQEEIHDGLKACYGDAAKGIRHLHEELPPEIVEQFFRQSSDGKRTYGHLLQLYASCLQRDYAENIHIHGRDEQIAAMEAALTAQDKMFHTWAVNWYKHNREALSNAVEEVTGLPVIAPDELYVPVRVETEPSGIPAEVVAWSPVPRALSRRVRHGLDFDENAHFLSMVNEQAEIRAQTIGYAMTGIILRDTIASRDVQTAARRNASPSDMNAVILHLRDILAQGAGQEKSVLESLKVLRKWAARFNIAWNPSSALAQPASIPVWANVLLDGEAWGATSVLKAMASAATEEGRAAIAELRASDGYRARYALGWSEEVANVFANPNEKKLLSKLGAVYDKGMILSQFTDAACSLWIAQGFYRHATDVFIRRGETIAEAKRKAMALTWAAIEQTQQSGRTENLSALQRGKGKNWWNAALQFKTAQILQNSYIIRAIRDVQAGVPGAKGRLARAIFISTVWVPGYLSLKGALWALIMGVKPEPDDEEEMPLWFREMLYSAADGMTAPLFVTSLFVEKPLREMLDLKSYPHRTGFASIDTIKRLAYDTYDLLTDPIMLEEELTPEKIIDDIWKVIGDVSAPVRHVRKAINNRRED